MFKLGSIFSSAPKGTSYGKDYRIGAVFTINGNRDYKALEKFGLSDAYLSNLHDSYEMMRRGGGFTSIKDFKLKIEPVSDDFNPVALKKAVESIIRKIEGKKVANDIVLKGLRSNGGMYDSPDLRDASDKDELYSSAIGGAEKLLDALRDYEKSRDSLTV